jgi:transcriptional regulator with XRE-family HTH domain/tetratricopeptide (TPR) repeat protein
MHADDLRVLVNLLRLLKGRTQREMAEATGINQSTISRLERGLATPSPQVLERLGAAASVPMWLIDEVLLPAIAVTRRVSTTEAATSISTVEFSEEERFSSALAIAEFVAASTHEAPDSCPAVSKSFAEQYGGATPKIDPLGSPLWELINNQKRAPGSNLEVWRELETITAHLCEESERVAADDAATALAIAWWGLRIARLARIKKQWRLRLEGYVWAYIGNALRVNGDLVGAEACFTISRRLWSGTASASGSILAEWRLLDLEASLRRARRQFDESFELLLRAQAEAPAEEMGRLLLKRAFTHEQAGQIDAALAILATATTHLDATSDPRLQLVARFNRLVLLCHLARYAEAEEGLEEVRWRADQLKNGLDLVRYRWLYGRVAAGRGRLSEAQAALEEVKNYFTDHDNAYDAALVSLELAIVYLKQRHTAEVQALAREVAWIFSAQSVGRETMAALTIFRNSVERNLATVELTRALLSRCLRERQIAQQSAQEWQLNLLP